jgi:hypothetical protein
LCETIGAERVAFVVAANLMECSLQEGDIDGTIAAGRDLAGRLRDRFHSDLLGFVLGLLAGALTASGDLEAALATARQAVPLLRDEGLLFAQFDHLALRAALAGHVQDAARIIGYADAIHIAFGRPREPIEECAARRVSAVLTSTLSDGEIDLLKTEGKLLTEEQAVALALKA